MGWVPFQLLCLGPFSNVRCTREDAGSGTADVIRDIRIELGGGTVISLGEIGVRGLATLMEVLTRRDDVGA